MSKPHPADRFMWGVVTALVGVPSATVTLWLLLVLNAVLVDLRRPMPEDPKGIVILGFGLWLLAFVGLIYLAVSLGAVRLGGENPLK